MDQSRFLLFVFVSFFVTIPNVDCYLGINWGRMATQRLVPSMVIDLLLQNGIPEVKIFSASKNMLEAFVGTDLGLTVTLPNDDLKKITSVEDAQNWIQIKLVPSIEAGLKIRYISIGTQPFSLMNFGKTYTEAADAMEFVQEGVKNVLPGRNVKVTIDHLTDLMNDAKKPSEAEFIPGLITDLMKRTTKSLVDNGSPIWLDIFPIFSIKALFDNDMEFAFFENNSTSHFVDDGFVYTNIFEVLYDKFAVALAKIGFPKIKIIIGQIGWPTDGIEGANLENAERYFRGLVKFFNSAKGTPRNPGPIDAYIHNLADENRLNISRGSYMRHWGIYRFDGKPKYNIDFSGRDRAVKPYSAKGVTHMPKRWCVFNTKSKDPVQIQRVYNIACNNSYTDCTSLAPGGSCGGLGFPKNISYAFNIYFQAKRQKVSEEVCDFEGLGIITPDDPSTANCSFPIEIIAAEEQHGQSKGGRGLILEPVLFIASMFLFILFTVD